MKTSFRVAAGLLATAAVGFVPATAQVTAQVNYIKRKQYYRRSSSIYRGIAELCIASGFSSPRWFREVLPCLSSVGC